MKAQNQIKTWDQNTTTTIITRKKKKRGSNLKYLSLKVVFENTIKIIFLKKLFFYIFNFLIN